jgi:hypothetical protein
VTEHIPDQPIKVTAQERTHPALRKLARACIALARHLADEPVPPPQPTSRRTTSPSEQPKEGTAAAGQERPHD